MQMDSVLAKAFTDNRIRIISSESKGESESPGMISDNRNDERRSIYDPWAARERRIRIDVAVMSNSICERLDHTKRPVE